MDSSKDASVTRRGMDRRRFLTTAGAAAAHTREYDDTS